MRSRKPGTVPSAKDGVNILTHKDLSSRVWSWYRSRGVHVVVDYRPALRARTGIGEYVHEVARALAATTGPARALTLFSSSWADRVAAERVGRACPARTSSTGGCPSAP